MGGDAAVGYQMGTLHLWPDRIQDRESPYLPGAVRQARFIVRVVDLQGSGSRQTAPGQPEPGAEIPEPEDRLRSGLAGVTEALRLAFQLRAQAPDGVLAEAGHPRGQRLQGALEPTVPWSSIG